MSKRALVTGITGQDGIYLSRILLQHGYKIFGFVRSINGPWPEGLSEIAHEIEFILGDLYDFSSLRKAVKYSKPTEVYNLAAQSSVMKSWTDPLLTLEATGVGAVRLLEAIRLENPEARFFQPSSSEMIGVGRALSDPLDAEYFPLSPYAASKLLAYHLTRLYREQYNLFAVSAVLFNHESPFRTPDFVSRKISMAAAQASKGRLQNLPMGNIDIVRDWGFAGDYMEAVFRLMQLQTPVDVIVATGVAHSVRDMLQASFQSVGLDYREYVKPDPTLLRSLDSKKIVGDPTKAMELLQWKPNVTFEALMKMMTEKDVERLR